MFLYDLGDSTILTREEEGRLSNIFQKGLALETIEAALWDQLQRTPTAAEVADALSGDLHGLSKEQLHQVLSQGCNTNALVCHKIHSVCHMHRRLLYCDIVEQLLCKYPCVCCIPVQSHPDMQSPLLNPNWTPPPPF